MEQSRKTEILSHDETFRYKLLSRMKSDCEYYLGNGNRHPKHLWAENEAEHIEIMRLLHQSFPEDRKPEWLSEADINNYEKAMVSEEPVQTPKEKIRGDDNA